MAKVASQSAIKQIHGLDGTHSLMTAAALSWQRRDSSTHVELCRQVYVVQRLRTFKDRDEVVASPQET